MLSFRTIFRSLALGAALTGVLAVPASSRAASIFVSIAPPAPPIYVRPAIPAYGYVWVDGYWAWGDEGYYWVPGYWTLPPYDGAIWEAGGWGYGGGGWGWTAGFWAHPAGYFGGVYYSNPWPWVGAYGICREGWYRNNFYDRTYYNGWYNDRWGHAHGRDFDDRRWNQVRTAEARWNGGRNGFNENRDGNRSVQMENRGFNRRAEVNNNRVNPGQSWINRNGGNFRGGQSHGNQHTPPQQQRFSAPERQRYSAPQQQHFTVPQQPRYNPPQQRSNVPQQRFSAQQRYSAPQQQRYSAPVQRSFAPAQRYSAPQPRGGEQRSSGARAHR